MTGTPTREAVLMALAAVLEDAATASGAKFVRNHPTAIDEGMRPAVLLFDGDEDQPVVPGKMGYGATWKATLQPVVVVQVDGASEDVGAALNLWHAWLMRAVHTSADLARRGAGNNHIRQTALVTGLRPDHKGAVASLHWHLAIDYLFDPLNPYS